MTREKEREAAWTLLNGSSSLDRISSLALMCIAQELRHMNELKDQDRSYVVLRHNQNPELVREPSKEPTKR